MKKFFTLCAASAMVMAASAAPQFAKAHRSVDLKPGFEHTLTAKSGYKIAAPAENKLNNNSNKSLHAKAEVIESAYDEVTVTDYGTDTWFIATSTDGAYKWYVNPVGSMDEIEFGKVYGMDEMLEDYTYAIDYATGGYIYFESIECVISEDWKMECNIVSTDGAQYHVFYKALEIPTETVDVELGDMDQVTLSDFISDMGSFQFMGHNSQYEFGICCESLAVEGSYDASDTYGGWQYTFVTENGVNNKLYDMEADITKLNDSDYAIEAKFYAYNGKNYILKTQYITPTPENYETITATNLVVDTSAMDLYMMFYGYGVYFIEASNDEHAVEGALITYDGVVPGHFSTDEGTINYITVDGVDMYSGSVDVVDEAGNIHVTGDILCWNSTVYTLDLIFTIPEVDSYDVLAGDDFQLTDLTENLGAIQICTADMEAEPWYSFVFDTDAAVSQHFDAISPAYKSYNYFYIGGEIYDIYSVDLDLEVEGEEFTLDGTCQAGSTLYTVEISGALSVPEPVVDEYDATLEDGDVDVVFSLEDISTYDVTPGEYVYISVDNGAQIWSALLYVEGEELPAGVYELGPDAQQGSCDGQYVYPTFYGNLTEEGYIALPMWYCYEGTITVSFDAEGNVSLDCVAVNTNGCNVHVAVNPQTVAIENVAAAAQKNGKFMENNSVVIRSNNKTYNGFGQMLK